MRRKLNVSLFSLVCLCDDVDATNLHQAGNLPFTATDDSITKHFTKVHPQSIRHRTDRTTGKSKGFAFLEFEAYDRMKTCLKVYHHSTFDDGQSPARRLNVELTYASISSISLKLCANTRVSASVGGGGAKSKDRKAKLKLKNVKLTEQRQRKAKEDEEHAKKEEREGGKKIAKKHKGLPGVVGEPDEQTTDLIQQQGDIHPTRRNRF